MYKKIILRTFLLVCLSITNLTNVFSQTVPPVSGAQCVSCKEMNGKHLTTCPYYNKSQEQSPSPTTPLINNNQEQQLIFGLLFQLNDQIDQWVAKEEAKQAAIDKSRKNIRQNAQDSINAINHQNTKQQLKGLPSKKEACYAAQKEVYRLLTLKIKFENQLYDLQKWNKDLDDLILSFAEDRDNYVDGWGDDLLNVIPIDKIKGGIKGSKQFLQGEKVEKAISATKMSKTTVDNLLKSKESSSDTIINAMKDANKSYTYAGQMIEGMALFANDKLQKNLEVAGKCLQMNGASAGLVNDNSNENIGNAAVDAVGLFVPPASLAAAGTKIVFKLSYSIYTDYLIHQLSTNRTVNLNAQEFLKTKINELNKQISTNQAIVDEYKKTDPAGCPVY